MLNGQYATVEHDLGLAKVLRSEIHDMGEVFICCISASLLALGYSLAIKSKVKQGNVVVDCPIGENISDSAHRIMSHIP